MQMIWDGFFPLGRRFAVGAARAVPNVNFLNLADLTAADQFERPAERTAVRPLVAHRRDHAMGASQVAQRSRLMHRAYERFFAEHMFSRADGGG
jgi:hypothetical protein